MLLLGSNATLYRRFAWHSNPLQTAQGSKQWVSTNYTIWPLNVQHVGDLYLFQSPKGTTYLLRIATKESPNCMLLYYRISGVMQKHERKTWEDESSEQMRENESLNVCLYACRQGGSWAHLTVNLQYVHCRARESTPVKRETVEWTGGESRKVSE